MLIHPLRGWNIASDYQISLSLGENVPLIICGDIFRGVSSDNRSRVNHKVV